jgi:hypothetical protein
MDQTVSSYLWLTVHQAPSVADLAAETTARGRQRRLLAHSP